MHKHRTVVWLMLMMPAMASTSRAQDAGRAAADTIERPKYADRRFDEDWSVLRGVDLSGPGHLWDRVKFMPLNDAGQIWLTLAGQVREREEYFREFQFGNSQPAQTDTYLASRIRFSADLHATRYVRVFAELKSSLLTHRDLVGGDSASFEDDVDLQNGFVDVVVPLRGASTLTLRAGRQELLFGDQRLVGPSDYSNVRRTFQGFSGIVHAGPWTITPFWTQLVVVQQHAFDQGTPDRTLWGTYATRTGHASVPQMDVYWLGARNTAASFNGTSGHEHRQTFGGRVFRDDDAGHMDYDLEGAGQIGHVDGQDVRAWMLTLNGGYTFGGQVSWRPFATLDYASGDDRVGGRVGTFNQLFPTNHTFLGNTDYIGRQNVLSPSGGVVVRPVSKLSVTFTQYWFWRASVRDAVYDSSGATLRAGNLSTDRHVGAESDAVVQYQFDRHVSALFSYNHFFPGTFIKRTGNDRSSDYLYAALQYTF